jgi:hypothetical protein
MRKSKIFIFNTICPYAISILFFIIINTISYFCLYRIEKNNNKILLQSYKDNIKTLLVADISNALELNISKKSFSFFNTVSLKQHNQECISCNNLMPFIAIRENIIIVHDNNQELKLDIQDFREHIAEILPPFVTYKFLLNKHNIASAYQKNLIFDMSEEIFYKNINLVLSFGLDRESEYYRSSSNKVLIGCLKSIFITFVLISIILFLYFRIKSKIQSRIIELENIITQYKEKNANLIKHNRIKQVLEEKFIKKVTELYVSQQYDWYTKYKQSNTIKNYLFPVIIKDLVANELEVKEVINYIEEYFICSNTNIFFEIPKNIKTIKIHCAQEVFYQIIISLIANIIVILEDQSSIVRKLIVTLTDNRISICYDGFPLTEQSILELSNTVLSHKLNVFLLDSSRVFKSLKEHNLRYNIFYKSNLNTIDITFNNTKQSSKVIKFIKNSSKVVI